MMRSSRLLLLVSILSMMKRRGVVCYSYTCVNRAGLRRHCKHRLFHSSSTRPQHAADAGAVRQSKYEQLMDASRLSLAPMMEYTDKHFRHVVRLISKRTLLYTEMVAANAVTHERAAQQEDYRVAHPHATDDQVRRGYDDTYLRRYLSQGQVEPLEGPSVLQVGGSDPQLMYETAQTVLDMADRGVCDYTALNLNCGCPSPKVAGKGCFGAALMEDAPLVAQLTQSLHEGCEGRMPITVKCRIGTDMDRPFTKQGYNDIDEEKEYAKLCKFIETVASNGIVTDFSVHARIAVLTKTFSPADNRKVPPLKYHLIRRLVKDFPEFTFSLNGGIESISQCQAEFEACPDLRGIMIGRAWAADPWSFAMADRLLYKDKSTCTKNRLQILQDFGKHADAEEAKGDPVKIRRFIVKAVTPLFAGEPNGKRYRIALDEIACIPKRLFLQGKTLEGQPPVSELIINAAMENLSEEVLFRSPEESYDLACADGQKLRNGRSENVAEWQDLRKQEGPSQYEQTLGLGLEVRTSV